MAVNVEKYNEEYQAILDYYNPIIKKYQLMAILSCLVPIAFLLLFFFGGKLALVGLIGTFASTSLVGRFATKRNAARKQKNRELRQLELARKQASISE